MKARLLNEHEVIRVQSGPDSQDRDCIKIAGMAMVYAQPVRPAAEVPMER